MSPVTCRGAVQTLPGQQVRGDDPRMNTVYRHFERNLADIIRARQRGGVGIVVSTVAVNSKDCAPFASVHRPGLSEPDKREWERLYQLGIEAQDAGKDRDAAERFRERRFVSNRACRARG